MADGAAGAEARVREAGRDPEPRHARRRAEQGTAVRRDALGTVDQVGQLGLGEHRNATDGPFENVVEELPVRGQELLREVPRHAVDRPRDWIALEAADQEPADLLAHVDEVLGITQAGCRAGQLVTGDRPRGQVLMNQGGDRQAEADHRRDASRPHTAGVDHALGPDGAVVGLDGADGAPRGSRDAGDPHARAQLDAEPTRPGGQLHRRAARIEPAIARQIHRAVQALGRHQREDAERLRGRDRVHVETDRLGHADLALQEAELVAAGGDAQAAHLVPVLGCARLRLQAAVQPDAVLPHAHQCG